MGNGLEADRVYVHNQYVNAFDDADNFIINDDGSQSANMMMLDGEYDPLIHQKINRSIGSSQGYRPGAQNFGIKSNEFNLSKNFGEQMLIDQR